MCKLTQYVHHGEAVVEGQTDNEPTSRKPEETGGACWQDAGHESGEVGTDQSCDTSETIGHPAEY